MLILLRKSSKLATIIDMNRGSIEPFANWPMYRPSAYGCAKYYI